MKLQNQQQLINTRAKLARLEARLEVLRTDTTESPRVRDLTMRSLKRLINQFKEEITLFEVHQPAARTG